MRIIVIDDEIAALNTFLLNIVDKIDFEYVMFNNNPLASIDYVKNNQVDAAFLDINMPLINGVELAKKLIEINHSIGIIFISGYTYNEKEIKKQLGNNQIGFCYKPYASEVLNSMLFKVKQRLDQSRKIFINTFGIFNVFIDDYAMKFSSSSAKELLALLIDKKGGFLTMESIITAMWPDKDVEKSKRLYRDAVYKLRKDLTFYNLNIVDFCRAKLRIISNIDIRCDYWDYLKDKCIPYGGIYLPSYDWSVETQEFLNNLQAKKTV